MIHLIQIYLRITVEASICSLGKATSKAAACDAFSVVKPLIVHLKACAQLCGLTGKNFFYHPHHRQHRVLGSFFPLPTSQKPMSYSLAYLPSSSSIHSSLEFITQNIRFHIFMPHAVHIKIHKFIIKNGLVSLSRLSVYPKLSDISHEAVICRRIVCGFKVD